MDGLRILHADDPAQAVQIQETLRHRCRTIRTIDTSRIRLVAGADAAYDQDMITPSVVVLTFPGLELVETTRAVRKATFPYIPGLLAFRKGPALLDAFFSLDLIPDLLFLNGHGSAHPRRFGIASHIGVILDIPTIGVAQRLLTGTAAMPGAARGSTQPVLGEAGTIGMAVRTLQGRKPVFVSAGHNLDLPLAVEMALRTTRNHRITEPVWHAHPASRQCRKMRSDT